MKSLVSGSNTIRAAPQEKTNSKPRLSIAQVGQCPHQQNAIPQGPSRASVVPVAGSTDGPRQVEVICYWDPSTEPRQGQGQRKTTYNIGPRRQVWGSFHKDQGNRAQGWGEARLQRSSGQDCIGKSDTFLSL